MFPAQLRMIGFKRFVGKMATVIFLFIGSLSVNAKSENLTALCEGEDVFCDPNTEGVMTFEGKSESSGTEGYEFAPEQPDVKEERACEFQERIFLKTPKAVKTENGGWKYLVSDQPLFSQPISIERCLYQDKPCSALVGLLTADVETECSQKYITVRVETVEPSTRVTSMGKVKIPVACVCSIRSNYFPGM